MQVTSPWQRQGRVLHVVRCHTRTPALGTDARSGTGAEVRCKALPFVKAEDVWGEETIQQAGLVPAGGDSPLESTLALGLLPHTS